MVSLRKDPCPLTIRPQWYWMDVLARPDEEYVLMLLEFIGQEGSLRVSIESEPFEVTNKCA